MRQSVQANRILLGLLVLVFLVSCSSSSKKPVEPVSPATLRLTVAATTATSSSAAQVPIFAEKFKSICGLELHVQYDTLKVTFDKVISKWLTDHLVVNAKDGVVHITWVDIDGALSLPEKDELLNMRFVNIAGTTSLVFTGNNEVVDDSGERVEIQLVDGSLKLAK